MNSREQAVSYLNELEDILVRIDTNKEYNYKDVLASLRSCYWLFKEYLRLEQRYDEALKTIEKFKLSER